MIRFSGKDGLLFSLPITAALGVILALVIPKPGAVLSSPAAAAVPKEDRPLTVKVAAVQCSSDLGDTEGNRKKLTALVKEAAGEGARIIVLPETSITGYLSQDLRTNWQLK